MVRRLDVVHHAFIQALLARGPLSLHNCKQMLSLLRPSEGTEDDAELLQFISSINKEMGFLQMELKATANQYDGIVYYGIVNRLANEQAKLGTRYSPAEIAFFKAVLELTASLPSSEGEISSMEALNIQIDDPNVQHSPGTSNLTLAQKEKTLTELVKDRWLVRREGTVALGVRSFLELGGVFKNLDIPFCDVCNEAGIKAQPCPNEECPVRIHDYCLKRKFHSRQVAQVCLRCGSNWAYDGMVSNAREDMPLSRNIASSEQQKPRRCLKTSNSCK